MLPLLSWTLYLLVINLSGANSHVMDTHTTSLPKSISSSILSESAPLQSCSDLKTCRTLDQIVVSCLATLLACAWLAIHRNIPPPTVKQPRRGNFFVRSAKWVWHTILNQREPAIVFVVALVAPEWIFAWAVRQTLCARALCKNLEAAREEATGERRRRDGMSASLNEAMGEIAGSLEGHASFDGSKPSQKEGIKNRYIRSRSDVECEECGGRGCRCDLDAAAQRVARADGGWTIAHAFLVIMGGFQFHNTHGPVHPLSPANVVELVARGHLNPPTTSELSNMSKGDALCKGFAIAQILWFTTQCIARHAEQLPMTSLEVTTLAYMVVAVAICIAWWDKPLNVSCAVRVPEEEVEGEDSEQYSSIWHVSIWDWIEAHVTGGQDAYVDLRERKGVPTFWAGGNDRHHALIADGVTFLVILVFGAVHRIPWYAEFQEQEFWRTCAARFVTAPAALIVIFGVALLIGCLVDRLGDSRVDNSVNFLAFDVIAVPLSRLVLTFYITSRLMILALSYTSLRGLPFGAYQTVQWTTVIPHI